MKILIINYFHAPTIDAHAYRWTQISEHWAKDGHEVTVITGKVKGSPRCSIENGVAIKRIGLMAKGDPTTKFASHAEPTFSQKLKEKAITALRPAYRSLYWPDALWHWSPSVLVEMARRRNTKYDLVISYYPGLSASLAALFFKKHAKSRTFKWIADYGDPFCTSDSWQPNNFARYNGLNIETELEISKYANMVFTNQATADAYTKKLGLQHPAHVIPHLSDVERFYAGSNYIKEEKDTINLCYIGAFHKNIREPFRLFELIRKLNRRPGRKYLLSIYGPANGFDLSPSDCPEITYHGPIERDKAIDTLKRADFIVNVDNENCVMTPSKIVECISTGRPIINISNYATSYLPIEKYTELGYAISFKDPDISEDIADQAAKFIAQHANGKTAPIRLIEEALHNHLLKSIAEKYLSLPSRKNTL